MQWHVIHAKVKEDFRSLENLQNQGFGVFLPTCQVQKKSQGKIKIATEPLFSSYLFIRLSDVSSNWFRIRSTRVEVSLLTFRISTDPVIISDPIIDCLKQRCTLEEPLHELFKLGETLEITNGLFKGLFGFLKSYKRFLIVFPEPYY